MRDVLDEGELWRGEGRRDAGLIDEDDAEAGADDGGRREEIGEAYAGGEVVEVQFAGAAGVSVLAEIVELLGLEIEDCTLVGLFVGGEVQGPARADVQGEAVGGLPIILQEVLFDLVAGADDALLKIDLEVVDLAEEEACEGVAAVGDALLVGAGGGECEEAGGAGRRDGVENVPAEVEARFEGVTAAGEDGGFEYLPDGCLVLREGAGRGAELLESGDGEAREGVVEGGVGGDAGNAERGGGGVGEGGAGDVIGAAGVAEAEVVDEVRGEGVRLVEDGLLAEDVGEADDSAGAEDGAGDGSAAVGERRDGLLDVVEVGVAGEGVVAGSKDSVEADVELILVVGVVGGAGVVICRGGVGRGGEAGEERFG